LTASCSPWADVFSDCYCADSIDAGTGIGAARGVCNIPCSGNPAQACGGNARSSAKLRARQASNVILIDVYANPTFVAGSTTSSGQTGSTSQTTRSTISTSSSSTITTSASTRSTSLSSTRTTSTSSMTSPAILNNNTTGDIVNVNVNNNNNVTVGGVDVTLVNAFISYCPEPTVFTVEDVPCKCHYLPCHLLPF